MNIEFRWSPDSWQTKPSNQQPVYRDNTQLSDVIARLQRLPPLVTSWEIENLKSQLALAARGKAFLLQGGDCCERLEDCESTSIVRKIKILMQMSFVLTYGSLKRVIRVGRIAGQYAKPRSSATETRDGITLPAYRGDIINRTGFSEGDRMADPELLIKAYERSALTLNFIRALCGGGFADLHNPENWDLDFAIDSPHARDYHEMVHLIANSLQFMETMLDRSIADSKSVEFFTSHEGLLLFYEQAQTRFLQHRQAWYNLGTHFPWIGNRTRQLDGSHVEYFRGIANPIAIKIDGDVDSAELVNLISRLNPQNELGRITLIHRIGFDRVSKSLPGIIQTVKQANLNVTWCVDPMHGNTVTTVNGMKTRHFDHVLSELTQAFDVHLEMGSHLGGVHLELTGDNVTECTGGARRLSEEDLNRAYKSPVDPRLNYDQAMEIAFLISQQLNKSKLS
ncbi:MAG TPA: 3-deoxy-7-phosphoheptulonate synthase class II [Pirellulaceae bacterium]|nr:3-deoxy-7-phosphoheptulonate synthase class II [Pirellulaceae bacterium]HMO90892.1 3-deoxy-7-phosphoheptulonate synthase class II [Pirellulaceae bacterium]HMP68632.1 3-deoxy-7-phosphoheptulonate synthase class II [Pirellulaceae bacterium]